MTFAGQRVAITGGSSGIGLALARRVGRLGATPILLARDETKLHAARRALADEHIHAVTSPLDVTDEAAVERTFATLGELDHVVTAAAGTLRGRLTDLTTGDARALFESKFWGQHHCVKHAAPFLRSSGSIALFSGWIARKPMIGTSTLAAVDGAIEALTRVLALELAPVRVNAVTPGMIDTPLWNARLSDDERRAHFERVGAALPVGRAGTPEDVADAVLFLLGNGFTTGAVLDVDGGQR